MYSTIQLSLEHIRVTFQGKAKWFSRKIICKQPKSESYIELIASYVQPKTGNRLRSHLLRPNFLRSTSLRYKILPRNLGACKPTLYIIYTSHLRWNSTMRHCFYHTDLGQQNAVFHNFAKQIAIIQYSGRSKHTWALAFKTVKKNFQNHLYGQLVLTFAVLAVASVWMNINTVKLQYNKEFIMFIFYFKMV